MDKAPRPNPPGTLHAFFANKKMDGDMILIELLVEHGSYVKVALVLKSQYGLDVKPTTVRYHANRLNMKLRFVYDRWFEKHCDDMIEYHRRDLVRED